ncbi:UNVERIFIED_ORG: hypothetical protein J2W85_000783 [Ensifer adhaerens]|nr:hypothetical protein [Ensifer adhaerens]
MEYLYLAHRIEDGHSIVLPFAGPLERALGDALTIEAENFEIIEFKHNSSASCLATESKKYGDGTAPFTTYFDQLEADLAELQYPTVDLPHRFVCGANIDNCFGLEYVPYWKKDGYNANPVGPDAFHLYARCLAAVRRPSANGEVSGGLVVGIDSLAKTMVLVELNQLLQALRMGMNLSFTAPQPPQQASEASPESNPPFGFPGG